MNAAEVKKNTQGEILQTEQIKQPQYQGLGPSL